jgi:U3 small nucleolar RNA-associated protein 7
MDTKILRTGIVNLHKARAQALVEDAEMLLIYDVGRMQVESEMDRTWKPILKSAEQEAAKGHREYQLDSWPYRSRYSRNRWYVCFLFLKNLVSSFFLDILLLSDAQVSAFDWQTGKTHSEYLQESC